MIRTVLGLFAVLAVVAVSGCPTSQTGQAIQQEQMASFLETQYGPQSSFASTQSPDPEAGFAPVVVGASQSSASSEGHSFSVEDAGNIDDESIISFDSAMTGESHRDSVESDEPFREVPVYNGGVVRQRRQQSMDDDGIQDPATRYAFPTINRQPQPFASGNPLRGQ